MSVSWMVAAACLLLAGVCSISLSAQDAPLVPSNVVPQGTVLLIQLTDRIDTHNVRTGDPFHARLAEPVTTANGMTIEEGRRIKGHISAIEPGLRTRLLLSFDEIDTGRGWKPLLATVTGVPGEHGMSQVGEEGEIGRKGITREQVAEAVVVGAGEGAEAGWKSGNKKAAAQGAGEGAANGAFNALESSHDLVLDKGTALEIRLDRNLTLAAR